VVIYFQIDMLQKKSAAKPKTLKVEIEKKTETKAKAETKTKTTKAQQPVRHVSNGVGLTAGLQLWQSSEGSYVLVDTSADCRFANDEALWLAAMSPSLKPASLKKVKDAATK
jgi:hypothetical protein